MEITKNEYFYDLAEMFIKVMASSKALMTMNYGLISQILMTKTSKQVERCI